MQNVPLFAWMTAGLVVLYVIAAAVDAGPPEVPDAQPEAVSTSFAPFESDFTLVDHNGTTVNSKTLTGKPTLVFFGFTYCPDICPTTLYDLSTLLDTLGDEAEHLQAMFISVDPERDTVEDIETYLSVFHPSIRGLTGEQDQIDKAVNAFFAYSEKAPLEDGDYLMNHNASVYLIGANGVFLETFAASETEEAKLQKIRRLLSGAGAVS